jgi:lipoprotein NlpI
MFDAQLIENKLSELLKTWHKVDQAWWVNAVQHSLSEINTVTLMGRITTSGKDEVIYAHEVMGA